MMGQNLQAEAGGPRERTLGTIFRYGVIAAGAAALALALGRKSAPSSVGAGNGGFGGDNIVATETTLTKAGGPTAPGLAVTNTSGVAITATSNNAIGVSALGLTVGVVGAANSNGATGVWGQVYGGATGQAVLGSSSTAIGVWGASQSSAGVIGSSQSSQGVVGTASAASTSGVYGVHTSPIGIGVSGQSGPGTGVQATSFSGIGLMAMSSTNTAIVGRSTSGKAAEFFGDVEITGNFIATGQKSAAVRVADGSVRRVYCVEAPQSYFEDFGRGEISDGVGTVTLDPTFASTVATDDYHVFLMPEGDCAGLCVQDRDPEGFSVRELMGGTSSITFSFRVVARRTGITNERFARVELSATSGDPTSGPQPTPLIAFELPTLPQAQTP